MVVIKEHVDSPGGEIKDSPCSLFQFFIRIIVAVPATPPVHPEVDTIPLKYPVLDNRGINGDECYYLLQSLVEGGIPQQVRVPDLEGKPTPQTA